MTTTNSTTQTGQNPPLFQNELTRSSRIIHTPSMFARTSLIHLQEVGSLTALAPHVSKRSHLQSYLFFIVTDGAGSLSYDGTSYMLHTNDCVFIDCRKPYSQGASDQKSAFTGDFEQLWSLKWVHFYGPTMSAIYDKYKERGGKSVFQSTHMDEYLTCIESVFHTASAASYTCDMQIAEKLTSLLALLMEDAWDTKCETIHSAPKRLSIKEIKDFLDDHYIEKLSLDDLAARFYINKQYLARIFKEQYGFTVNGYLSRVRITNAKSMLRFSDKNIEEISTSVGFSDPNYFSRTFKKLEGISPSQYRESW